jgi:hypothetical protein
MARLYRLVGIVTSEGRGKGEGSGEWGVRSEERGEGSGERGAGKTKPKGWVLTQRPGMGVL